jgi:hypothetical protein
MSLNEITSISLELQGVDIVLTDQIRDPSLGISDPGRYLGGKFPFQLLWRCFEIGSLSISLLGFRLGPFGMGGEFSFEQRRCGGIDSLGVKEYELCVDVCGVSQDSVTVFTCMLEIDSSFSIRADDDLELPSATA